MEILKRNNIQNLPTWLLCEILGEIKPDSLAACLIRWELEHRALQEL